MVIFGLEVLNAITLTVKVAGVEACVGSIHLSDNYVKAVSGEVRLSKVRLDTIIIDKTAVFLQGAYMII